jgi:predicted outer membrane repeat protein
MTGSGATIYVDGDAKGMNDGSSWENAYRHLQDALADANDSEKPIEIRIAQGGQHPDQGAKAVSGDRHAAFRLINGVTLRGGYAGVSQPAPNLRDVRAYETILSGDLKEDDLGVANARRLPAEITRAENSHHVVIGEGVDETAVLDGLTIADGQGEADSADPAEAPSAQGGGMYCVFSAPTVVNCTFRRNVAGDGGGVYSSTGVLRLTDCLFSDNVAVQQCVRTEMPGGRDTLVRCLYGSGGAIYNARGGLQLSGCTFVDNLASNGAAIRSAEDDSALIGCFFSRNAAEGSAGGEGGAISASGSRSSLASCRFVSNSAADGGAILTTAGSSWKLAECLFKDNFAQQTGGAIANYQSEVSMDACRFAANTAKAHGGAVYNQQSEVLATRSIFAGNLIPATPRSDPFIGGGAIYNEDDNGLVLSNCTFVGNKGQNGNAIRCCSSSKPSRVTIRNSVLRGDRSSISVADQSMIEVAWSNVQGGWPGEGNMDGDPLFAEPGYWDPNSTPDNRKDDFWVDGDYHLKSQAGRWDPKSQSWVKEDVTSPCIDAGDSNSPVGEEPFPNGGRINMGAYGGTAEASKSYFGEPVCETIIAGDINGDCKVDFKDLAILAQHWLNSSDTDSSE